MILTDIMREMGIALAAIPGLRVKPYTEQRISPPQAMVNLPQTYTFDSTMGRGSDDIRIPVVVYVGRFDAESSINAIAQYVDGKGGKSVKEAIEAHKCAAYDIAHVIDVQFIISTVSSTEYLAATFRVRVVGKG
ncbi:MAG TPA: hypothetical protein VIU11_14455 [Nakamurella sp.]